MLTEEWASDIATAFKSTHGITYMDDPAEYERMSPIVDIHAIDVPMLILHSENDLRCPIIQAEELFIGLRLLGKDVTFYRFPGEGHELTRSGSPSTARCAPRSSSTGSPTSWPPAASPAPSDPERSVSPQVSSTDL